MNLKIGKKNMKRMELICDNRLLKKSIRDLDVCKTKLISYLDELKDCYIYITFYKIDEDLIHKIRSIMILIKMTFRSNSSLLLLLRNSVYELTSCKYDSRFKAPILYFTNTCINFITTYEKALKIKFNIDKNIIFIK